MQNRENGNGICRNLAEAHQLHENIVLLCSELTADKCHRRLAAELICKSNKALHSGDYGRCVAGITDAGEWIRLVSSENGDSIPEADAELIPLEGVIEAEVVRAPLAHQIENAVLLKYTVTRESSEQFVRNLLQVNEKGVFGNTKSQLSALEAKRVDGTLRLIDVENLTTYRLAEGSCKARFVYQGCQYIDMAMTDPNSYARPGSERAFGNAHIIVSLPEDQPYIKFIAAIYSHK